MCVLFVLNSCKSFFNYWSTIPNNSNPPSSFAMIVCNFKRIFFFFFGGRRKLSHSLKNKNGWRTKTSTYKQKKKNTWFLKKKILTAKECRAWRCIFKNIKQKKRKKKLEAGREGRKKNISIYTFLFGKPSPSPPSSGKKWPFFLMIERTREYVTAVLFLRTSGGRVDQLVGIFSYKKTKTFDFIRKKNIFENKRQNKFSKIVKTTTYF